ncbi:MAG TPA: cupin domain-containing protein [Thermodesulfobacteriota bacterium]|jgi:quercetin dioxygenase-like cupin family protein|nr:cupin domain-containing protein [Thermodesulfobacteriota bacterium]
MGNDYNYIGDLSKEIGEIPKNGIISRTLHNDEYLKAILFGFDEGQELSEHTSLMPATIHIIKGEARLKLGEDSIEAQAGAWVNMSPGLRHAVQAKTPLLMLLLLIKSREPNDTRPVWRRRK